MLSTDQTKQIGLATKMANSTSTPVQVHELLLTSKQSFADVIKQDDTP